MSQTRGYRPVLRNRNFLKLWIAQILSLMSLQSLLLVSLILIEEVNQSSIQAAGVVIAFSLPAVIFGPIAGIFLDRISKKTILVVSNAFRVGSQVALALLAYLGVNRGMDPALFLGLVYFTIFMTSAIGQFFAPAEGATIPLVVGRWDLFAANSLFTLTIIAMQVVALIVYVPVAVKTLGLVNTFASLAVFYTLATALLFFLPADRVLPRKPNGRESGIRIAWREIGEGWDYVLQHKSILIAILQFSLVFTIVSVLGEQAPGYASRVLGLKTEDAVFVFSPAGLGMVLASLVIVRIGPRLPRFFLPLAGMLLMGIGLITLGLIGFIGKDLARASFQVGDVTVTALWLIVIVSPLVGVGLAFVLIPAQTVIQEQSTDDVRGRVLTVQLTLANALSIPLLLFAGALADLFGISQIVIALGAILFFLAVLNWWYVRRNPPPPVVPTPFHTQPIPLPGESPAVLEEAAKAEVRR